MVLLGFTVPNARENILSGRKITTIRPKLTEERKASMIKNGLHLYDKPRTKDMKLIAHAEVANIKDIVFKNCTPMELMLISAYDGFTSVNEMKNFFFEKYGKSYNEKEFSIIEWKNLVTEGN